MPDHPYPRILVYTDLDECLLGRNYKLNGLEALLEDLRLLGVPVVPATSKTIHELLILRTKHRIGITPLGFIAVAEEGAAIYTSRGLLEEAVEAPEDLEALELSPRLEEIEPAIQQALEACRGEKTIRFTRAKPETISKLTGLSPQEAKAAGKRTYTEVVWSPNKKCLEKIKHQAEQQGLRTFMGRRFLHLAAHRGKAHALEKLLEKTPRLRTIKLVVALGDTELDKEMIEKADIGIIVPHPEGQKLHPRGANHQVAPQPAPTGWKTTIKQTITNLL